MTSNSGKSKKHGNRKASEFEFCKFCKVNQDHGNRHKYFPNHRKFVGAFLARFHSKLANIRILLKDPSYGHGVGIQSRTRLWCVFCEVDIDDASSEFSCENAIAHLADEQHRQKVKHFLWKYGGRENDSDDTFCFLESDIAKWKAKCRSLQSDAEVQGGLVNNIPRISEFVDNSYTSNVPNYVTPLRCHTHELQICPSTVSDAVNNGSSLPIQDPTFCSTVWNLHGLKGGGVQKNFPYHSSVGSCDHENGRVSHCGEVQHGNRRGYPIMENSYSQTTDKVNGSLNTGAPPPWLESYEPKQLHAQLHSASTNFDSVSSKAGNSKLNPKRVGAAWAERRKAELELEKRGEIPKSNGNADWLPNFGRVWQSGTRKESLKEFTKERQKFPLPKQTLEMPVSVQPYISKRMRRASDTTAP